MPQQSEILDTQVQSAKPSANGRPQPGSGEGLRDEGRTSVHRSLKIRIGGWIANFFSWYRY
jgi:hypothetical protein